jgi:hypothetical protein
MISAAGLAGAVGPIVRRLAKVPEDINGYYQDG